MKSVSTLVLICVVHVFSFSSLLSSHFFTTRGQHRTVVLLQHTYLNVSDANSRQQFLEESLNRFGFKRLWPIKAVTHAVFRNESGCEEIRLTVVAPCHAWRFLPKCLLPDDERIVSISFQHSTYRLLCLNNHFLMIIICSPSEEPGAA